MAFASGKRAYGICDTCGQRYRLHQLQEQWDGFKGNSVCAGPTVQSTPPPLAPAVPVPELAVKVYVLLL